MRLVHGALVILVLLQISQFRSLGKGVSVFWKMKMKNRKLKRKMRETEESTE